MAFTQTVLTFGQKTVTLAAQNVKNGLIDKHWLLGRSIVYVSYAVPTGASAPSVDDVIATGRKMFANGSSQEVIASSVDLDVYVYAVSESERKTENGKLVVSI